MNLRARRSPQAHRDEVRLLAVDPERHDFSDARAEDLPLLLSPGDVLVVNDAATVPASLFGRTKDGAPIEVRLCAHGERARFRAVLFGEGDWRTKTEDRPAPPPVAVGERIFFDGLTATVRAISPASVRLVDLELDLAGAALWSRLYAIGRPVQYSYLGDDMQPEAVSLCMIERMTAAIDDLDALDPI